MEGFPVTPKETGLVHVLGLLVPNQGREIVDAGWEFSDFPFCHGAFLVVCCFNSSKTRAEKQNGNVANVDVWPINKSNAIDNEPFDHSARTTSK